MQDHDSILIRRIAKGDTNAFTSLIRRHQAQLLALIRRELADPDHWEDVWQETLLAAWVGLRKSMKVHHPLGWLVQVARNRCRDHFRSPQRRIQSAEPDELEMHLHRRIGAKLEGNEAADRIEALLREATRDEMRAARKFYLHGLRLLDIARQENCPVGTIKRRLFVARNELRQKLRNQLNLPLPLPRRRMTMTTQTHQKQRRSFPKRMPKVSVVPSSAKTFAVTSPEMSNWFVIPKIGDHTMWAIYDAPDWRLTEVTDMQTTRPITIHGLEGVEIQVRIPLSPDEAFIKFFFVRMTETTSQWLAVATEEKDGSLRLRTFLDKDFDDDWHEGPRIFVDRGRFVQQPDGSYKQTSDDPTALGAGMFRVTIGDKTFSCLRIFEEYHYDQCIPMKQRRRVLIEKFYNKAGRCILDRHYCESTKGKKPSKGYADLPDSPPIVLDGVLFLPWYNCIGHIGCNVNV